MKKRAINCSEDTIHIAIVDYLKLALPREALFFHPPNGGYRHAREGAKFKRMGARAGIPDLIILHNGRAIGLEVKGPKGYQSREQKIIQEIFGDVKCPYYIVRSIDDAIDALRAEGVVR